jgi:hypothetical protein
MDECRRQYTPLGFSHFVKRGLGRLKSAWWYQVKLALWYQLKASWWYRPNRFWCLPVHAKKYRKGTVIKADLWKNRCMVVFNQSQFRQPFGRQCNACVGKTQFRRQINGKY